MQTKDYLVIAFGIILFLTPYLYPKFKGRLLRRRGWMLYNSFLDENKLSHKQMKALCEVNAIKLNTIDIDNVTYIDGASIKKINPVIGDFRQTAIASNEADVNKIALSTAVTAIAGLVAVTAGDGAKTERVNSSDKKEREIIRVNNIEFNKIKEFRLMNILSVFAVSDRRGFCYLVGEYFGQNISYDLNECIFFYMWGTNAIFFDMDYGGTRFPLRRKEWRGTMPFDDQIYEKINKQVLLLFELIYIGYKYSPIFSDKISYHFEDYVRRSVDKITDHRGLYFTDRQSRWRDSDYDNDYRMSQYKLEFKELFENLMNMRGEKAIEIVNIYEESFGGRWPLSYGVHLAEKNNDAKGQNQNKDMKMSNQNKKPKVFESDVLKSEEDIDFEVEKFSSSASAKYLFAFQLGQIMKAKKLSINEIVERAGVTEKDVQLAIAGSGSVSMNGLRAIIKFIKQNNLK